MYNVGDFSTLWNALLWPMLRLLIGLSIGLLIANTIESLRWTRHLAKVASPLAKAAHLRDVTGAAFSTAFFSPSAANGLLSESYEKGELSKKELLLSNVFNSLPSYLTHTPSIFFLTYPVLGFPAVIYVGLTLLAAAARTILTVFVARLILPAPPEGCVSCLLDDERISFVKALDKAWKRFKKRVPRLLVFTVPIYILMYFLQINGFFASVELWLSNNVEWLSFLKPQAMGIIVLHLAAELGAALSAAGSIFVNGGLSAKEIVLALLVGNILSTPMRAIRHQLPSYTGFFSPSIALLLIITNQGLRAISMAVVTLLYYLW